MNLKLVTKTYGLYGTLGEYHDEQDNFICYTLEHSFLIGSQFVPKLPRGSTYTCQRGMHLLEPTDLHPSPKPFQTFEVMNVPPFQGNPVTGLLAGHVGNYNKDSDGCVLLGLTQGAGAILDSALAFEKWMELQTGVDSFTLCVI